MKSKQKFLPALLPVELINLAVRMEENSEPKPGTSTDAAESVEVAEEEIDMREIDRIDEILGNSPSETAKMLEFERQMFIDCCYNDGLVVCGK